MLSLILSLVKKDLRQYAADRKALIISLVVPLAIGCFLASLFGSQGNSGKRSKIPVLVVSELDPAETALLSQEWAKSDMIQPILTDRAKGEAEVKAGKRSAMLIIPKGFLKEAESAMAGGPRPSLEFVSDPSRAIEAEAARGMVIQGIIRVAVKEQFGASSSMGSSGSPFELKSRQIGSDKPNEDKTASTAHPFAGMAIQGIMFGAIEMAMGLMRERQRGLLKRLKSAPLSPKWFLLGRILSSAIRSLFVLIVVLTIGSLIFHFRPNGSYPGLFLVLVASGLCFASFGVLVASLGQSEQQSRGLATFAVLMMSMLGGAWFPTFMFPAWAQKVTSVIPVKWAVDGIDSMMWRGLGLTEAGIAALVLVGFAILFGLIGVQRFRWEPDQTS